MTSTERLTATNDVLGAAEWLERSGSGGRDRNAPDDVRKAHAHARRLRDALAVLDARPEVGDVGRVLVDAVTPTHAARLLIGAARKAADELREHSSGPSWWMELAPLLERRASAVEAALNAGDLREPERDRVVAAGRPWNEQHAAAEWEGETETVAACGARHPLDPSLRCIDTPGHYDGLTGTLHRNGSASWGDHGGPPVDPAPHEKAIAVLAEVGEFLGRLETASGIGLGSVAETLEYAGELTHRVGNVRAWIDALARVAPPTEPFEDVEPLERRVDDLERLLNGKLDELAAVIGPLRSFPQSIIDLRAEVLDVRSTIGLEVLALVKPGTDEPTLAGQVDLLKAEGARVGARLERLEGLPIADDVEEVRQQLRAELHEHLARIEEHFTVCATVAYAREVEARVETLERDLGFLVERNADGTVAAVHRMGLPPYARAGHTHPSSPPPPEVVEDGAGPPPMRPYAGRRRWGR